MKSPRRENGRAGKTRSGCLGGCLEGAYTRFLKIRGEPREIAMGLALGLMVGMTPFMGFHTVIAVFLAALCKWNKIAAAAGVLITNPLTAPFIYPVTYMVGKAALGVSEIPGSGSAVSLETVLQLIRSCPLILVDMTVGGIILGMPISIAAYWLSRVAVENYRGSIKAKLREEEKAELLPRELTMEKKSRGRGEGPAKAIESVLGQPWRLGEPDGVELRRSPSAE